MFNLNLRPGHPTAADVTLAEAGVLGFQVQLFAGHTDAADVILRAGIFYAVADAPAADGEVKLGAAVLASVSVWSAAGGAVRNGAASLVIVSGWAASGGIAQTEVIVSTGGGFWRPRPRQAVRRFKGAAARMVITSTFSAQASAIRRAKAEPMRWAASFHNRSRARAVRCGVATMRGQSRAHAQAIPIRGIGAEELAAILSLIE